MNPIAAVLGIAAGGFGLYKALKKPSASDFQVQNVVSASGVPVKVVTPIPKQVTPSQRTGIVTAPPVIGKASAARPTTVKANGVQSTVFAPPGSITSTGAGSEPAPIITTPTGTSSVAIGTTTDVQRALNTLGFLPKLQEDGKLGPKTIANIRAFQSKNGLAVDGNAGPATKAKLSSALTGLASSGGVAKVEAARAKQAETLPAPYVAKQAASMSAKDVQRHLNMAGANPKLVEDGNFGPKSVAALKSFQLSHGLVADGVCGPRTKEVLYATPKTAAFESGWMYPKA